MQDPVRVYDLHATLLQATGNIYIMSLTTGVNAAVNTTTKFKQRDRPLPRDPVPDHLRVFQAIADKDPAAAKKAMSTLIHLALLDTPVPQHAKARQAQRRHATRHER